MHVNRGGIARDINWDWGLVAAAVCWLCVSCGAATYQINDFDEDDGIELRDLNALMKDSSRSGSTASKWPRDATVSVERLDFDFSTQKDEYVLGKNDVLSIFVAGHPEMSSQRVNLGQIQGTVVQKDGNVYLPVIDALKAEGLTLIEFRAALKAAVSLYIVDPEVSVEILEYESQKFYVLGHVTRPGVFPVDGDTTLLEGLGLAGGARDSADLEGSYVLRDGKLLPINLADMLLRGDVTRNAFMRGGDVIFVADGADQKIYVLGEVNRPGIIPIERNRITLAEALAGAGGTAPATASSEIAVVRGGHSEPVVYRVDLDTALLFDGRIRLQPGDRVIVAPTGLATSSRYMSMILPFLAGAAASTEAATNGVELHDRFAQ